MHIKIEFYLWFVRTTQYRHIHTYLLTHRSMIVVNPPLLNTMSMKCDRAIIYVLMTAFTTFISNLRPAHSTQNSATFLQGKKKYCIGHFDLSSTRIRTRTRRHANNTIHNNNIQLTELNRQ